MEIELNFNNPEYPGTWTISSVEGDDRAFSLTVGAIIHMKLLRQDNLGTAYRDCDHDVILYKEKA